MMRKQTLGPGRPGEFTPTALECLSIDKHPKSTWPRTFEDNPVCPQFGPGSEDPWGKKWKPTLVVLPLENSMNRGADELHPVGHKESGHDWARTHTDLSVPKPWFPHVLMGMQSSIYPQNRKSNKINCTNNVCWEHGNGTLLHLQTIQWQEQCWIWFAQARTLYCA